VPSHKTRIGDVITIREGSKKSPLFSELDKKLKNYNPPAWLSFDVSKLEGKVTGKPKNTEGFFNFNSVFEYYSR
jgi:small subunit ribosomal protein S4